MTCLAPPERVVVPRSADVALPDAAGAPFAITGGQAAAHAPEHCGAGPLSASNMYTVSCLGPAARIVPNLLCLVVTSVAAARAVEALDVAASDPYEPLDVLDLLVATALPELGDEAPPGDGDELLLELLPHAAANMQPRISKATP
jgi:hypothetical protein